MKKKSIKQAVIFLVAFALMSCDKDSNATLDATLPTSTIYGLIEQNVVLTSGINFETGKPVVFNPLTGQEVRACIDTATYSVKQPSKDGRLECNIKETELTAPPAVLDAIKSSREIINGSFKKNGKEIPARFIVSVTALFEGSMCVTHWSGGNEFEDCVTVKQRCNFYVPRHSRITPNVTATCSSFPEWPDQLIPTP